MGWTLLASEDAKTAGLPLRYLPKEGKVHIVKMLGALGWVHELQHMHTELGRITNDSRGTKLEAVNHSLSYLPGQAHGQQSLSASDPEVVWYELLPPGVNVRSEVIFLRHGDLIKSSEATGSLLFKWEPSEVQVNSSAADVEIIAETGATVGVIETAGEETEDEDADTIVTAVEATQKRSQHPRATPHLSNQPSVVIQETPTAARINGASEYPAISGIRTARTSTSETTPPQESNIVGTEQYSTARTGESQHNAMKSIEQNGSVQNFLVTDIERDAGTPTPTDHLSNAVEDLSEDTPRSRHPQVLIPKKRSGPPLDIATPETELVSRSSKRAKRTTPDAFGTQDSPMSNIVVDTERESTPVARGRNRRSEIKLSEDFQETPPAQSQRSSQHSAIAELYEGDAPSVALSNSSITPTHHSVKFLKKNGGSLVESLRGDFNVLCIRDGSLHKTAKVLRAIAGGIPIVTDKWLLDSAKAKHFLSVEVYRPSIPKEEAEWRFSLQDVLGQPQAPFEGYTVHFTSKLQSDYKAFGEIEQVCTAAGAKKVTKKKMDKTGNIIVLASESGDSEAEKLMQEGVVCYIRDLLPYSIFRGSLNLASDEFRLKPGGTGADPAKETSKKRGRKS